MTVLFGQFQVQLSGLTEAVPSIDIFFVVCCFFFVHNSSHIKNGAYKHTHLVICLSLNFNLHIFATTTTIDCRVGAKTIPIETKKSTHTILHLMQIALASHQHGGWLTYAPDNEMNVLFFLFVKCYFVVNDFCVARGQEAMWEMVRERRRVPVTMENCVPSTKMRSAGAFYTNVYTVFFAHFVCPQSHAHYYRVTGFLYVLPWNYLPYTLSMGTNK